MRDDTTGEDKMRNAKRKKYNPDEISMKYRNAAHRAEQQRRGRGRHLHRMLRAQRRRAPKLRALQRSAAVKVDSLVSSKWL